MVHGHPGCNARSREHDGDSAVLSFAGSWLLLTSGGPPTDDKPDVTLAAPAAAAMKSLWRERLDGLRRFLET